MSGAQKSETKSTLSVGLWRRRHEVLHFDNKETITFGKFLLSFEVSDIKQRNTYFLDRYKDVCEGKTITIQHDNFVKKALQAHYNEWDPVCSSDLVRDQLRGWRGLKLKQLIVKYQKTPDHGYHQVEEKNGTVNITFIGTYIPCQRFFLTLHRILNRIETYQVHELLSGDLSFVNSDVIENYYSVEGDDD